MSRWVLVMVGVPLLSACAGGDGAGTPAAGILVDPLLVPIVDPLPVPIVDPLPTPVVEPPLIPVEARDDYRLQWGLDAIGASRAFARIRARDGQDQEGRFLPPGIGGYVVIVDTGVDREHPDLPESLVLEDLFFRSGQDEQGDEFSHGTAVTGVISARYDLEENDVLGVAPGAVVSVIALPLGSADVTRPYTPIGVDQLQGYGNYLARVLARVPLKPRRITFTPPLPIPIDNPVLPNAINLSFGQHGLIEDYTEASLRLLAALFIRAEFRTADGEQFVHVVAAGNANGFGGGCIAGTRHCEGNSTVHTANHFRATSPELLAGLPVHIAELRDNWVAVVAVDRDRRIAAFSNRCGVAARWCLAAPGAGVPVLYYGPDLDEDPPTPGARGVRGVNGTSFAAPHVSGGLALLEHAFRGDLSNVQLLDRLYQTAEVTPDPVPPGAECPAHLDIDGDRSNCELSSLYGRGMINLDTAAAPVGTLTTGGVQVHTGLPVAGSLLRGGGATGDALLQALAGRELAVFDSLGAPFWMDATRFVRDLPAHPPALQSSVADWTRAASVPSARGSHFSPLQAYRGSTQTLAITAFASAGGMQGLGVAWTPTPGFGLGLGWLDESDSLLQMRSSGAFGNLGGNSLIAGFSGGLDSGPWRTALAAELGVAWPAVDGPLLQAAGPLLSSGWSLSLQRQGVYNGTLQLALQQPVRVEHGGLQLQLPTGRTPGGTVLYEQHHLSLSPAGRQLDLALHWTTTLAGGELTLGTVWSHQPGHRRARADLSTLLNFTLGL